MDHTTMRVNTVNRLVTDFGEHDVDRLYEDIKKITCSSIDSACTQPSTETLCAAAEEWATKVNFSGDTDDLVMHFVIKTLISIIEIRGLKEWKSPFI